MNRPLVLKKESRWKRLLKWLLRLCVLLLAIVMGWVGWCWYQRASFGRASFVTDS